MCVCVYLPPDTENREEGTESEGEEGKEGEMDGWRGGREVR